MKKNYPTKSMSLLIAAVASAAAVSAPASTSANETVFKDISTTSVFYGPIIDLFHRGIVNGYPDYYYEVNKPGYRPLSGTLTITASGIQTIALVKVASWTVSTALNLPATLDLHAIDGMIGSKIEVAVEKVDTELYTFTFVQQASSALNAATVYFEHDQKVYMLEPQGEHYEPQLTAPQTYSSAPTTAGANNNDLHVFNGQQINVKIMGGIVTLDVALLLPSSLTVDFIADGIATIGSLVDPT